MAGMADARTDEIACSFCLEYGRYLTRPRSLPCGHYCCEPCLETDFITQKVVRCIRCSTVYDIDLYSLPHADTSESTTPVFCDACSKKGEKLKAEVYCAACTQCLCTKHKQSHDEFFDNHKKMTVEEYRKQCRKFVKKTCTKHHGQSLITGCQICWEVFCVECMTEPTACKDGSAHRTQILEKLVKYIEGEVDILKKEASKLDTKLSAYSKKCATILEEQKTEIDSFLKVLHETRDKQLADIRAKYDKLEAELVEKRETTHREIEEFISDKLGDMISDLRREIKHCEARLRDNHQVDVVVKYKDAQSLIKSLLAEKTPSLKIKDVVELKKTAPIRGIEVKIITTDPISLTEDREHSKLTNQIPAVLAPPTSIKLLQEVSLDNMCTTVCRYQNQTYVDLDGGSVVRIGPDYKVTPFIKLSDVVTGMAVFGDQLVTTTYGNPQTVSIHEFSTGRLVTSWAHSDDIPYIWASNLAVVGEQIIISDRGNKRLSVYSKVGRLIKHIPCPQLSPDWVSLSAADNDSIILSDYKTSKVHKISITTGDVIWTSSDVTRPNGVTCYNNQYVLVASFGNTTKISMLDIRTGNMIRTLEDPRVLSDDRIFSLCVEGDTLIGPRYIDKKVLYYRLE